MGYLGAIIPTYDPSRAQVNITSPDRFSGDGSTVAFTLTYNVSFATDLEVFVDGVQQEPTEAYGVSGKTITFTGAPGVGTNNIYVIYRAAVFNNYATIPDGSITYAKLANNIRLFTEDIFTANGTGSTYTLTETPASANTVLVHIDGVLQSAPTNYDVSGTTLTFTSAPDASSKIVVKHLGFRTTTTLQSVTGITGTLATTNGGTGLTSFTSNGALYATNTSALTTGTLPVASGGTGLTTYTQGDIVYASGTDTLGKIADVATGNVLISGGAAGDPSWGKANLTTHVSGTLPITNGGTNLTTYTTGDIVYASATNTLASLADVATGNVLISGGVSTAPSYGKVGLTTHVSGTLPVANGGTGVTTSTGTGSAVLNTAPTLSLPVIENIKMGYSTTATAAGTTTLTASSNYRQLFTGASTQTVQLPVTSTLTTGMSFEIENNSTGLLTVTSSGGNTVGTLPSNTCGHALCIGTSLTTAADWDFDYISFAQLTGTGAVTLNTAPTISRVTLAAGTASANTSPLKLISGTNLTTAEVGAVEYDGSNFYITSDTTHGRNVSLSAQQFQLSVAGSAIGPASNNYFGATSAASLAASSTYDIDCHCYFLKSTAGTLTWAPTFSSAATVAHAIFDSTPITGFTTTNISGAMVTAQATQQTVGAMTFAATGSLTTAVYHIAKFTIRATTNAACNFRLNVTNSAGTITPQAGSFYTVRRVVNNAGTFAA